MLQHLGCSLVSELVKMPGKVFDIFFVKDETDISACKSKQEE